MRDINSESIDLHCSVQDSVHIDRKLPDWPKQSDPTLCLGKGLETSPDFDNDPCTNAKPVVDQFCTGHKKNDQCSTTLIVHRSDEHSSREIHESGICKTIQDTMPYYHYGHRTAVRDALECVPLKTPSPTVFKSISLSQKLKSWFN